MGAFHYRSHRQAVKHHSATGERPVLRVGSTSPVRTLAGSIAHALRENESILLRAIGAGAVNQAVKGVALARSYLAGDGIEIGVFPAVEMTDEGGRSAVEMEVRRV